jgi:arsenate reductase
MEKKKKKVLFLCTHNSARSQMAEGILRHFYGDEFKVFSAGVSPSKVNPYAIKVMAEIEIDISKHKSKSVNEFIGKKFDYVVTVCDNAKKECPFFPGSVRYIHWNLIDPSEKTGSEEKIIAIFRKVRDEIKQKIEETFS